MTRHNQKTILSLLVFASAVLAIAGFAYFAVTAAWYPLAIILWAASAISAVVFMIGSFQLKSVAWQWISVQRKLMTAVFMVLLLVAWGLVNYLGVLTQQAWDITRYKQHTLSAETKNILKDLRTSVRMIAFYVGIPDKYLTDLMDAYQQTSGGMVTTEVVDPLVQLGYAAQFGQKFSGQEKRVVVQSGDMRKDVDFAERILNEEMLTNAILSVTRPRKTVYFLTGHGEFDPHSSAPEGYSRFAEILESNNFEIQKIFLGGDEQIPRDGILIVAGPKQLLSEKEQKILQDYLIKGGDAFFIVEHVVLTTPDKPLTEEESRLNPSLNEILTQWGVKVADDVVVDLASHVGGDVGSPATNRYMKHTSLITDLDYTFYIRPRSMSVVPARRSTLKVAPFVLTMSDEQSWGETNRTLQIKFDDADRAGPVPISFVIWEPKETEEDSDTRMIVFTDGDFLSNAYLDFYTNARMGINVVNWLAENDYRSFLADKTIDVPRMDLTSRQKREIVGWLLVIPLLIVTIGLWVWVVRD